MEWEFVPNLELTKKEKKSILAHVLAIGVQQIFHTYVYQFGAKVYHQQKGGPIGLRATAAIANVVM